MQDIFSVPIEILQLNNLDNDLLVNYAKKKYNSSKKYENCFSYDVELQDLKSVVLQSAEKFSTNYTGNTNNKIIIKRVWPNIHTDNSLITPHAHRDSFLSAVYYPKADNGELVIQSPFSHSHLSHVDPNTITKYNAYNSDNFFIPVKTGMLIIFNAMLIHYVKPINGERYSIAFDLELEK